MAKLHCDLREKSGELGFREFVPCESVKDFGKKYFQTFGRSRSPEALSAYAAKVSSLKDGAMKRALEVFVSNVLEGRFIESRYLKENSLHLKLLIEKSPEVFSSWQKGSETSLGKALSGSGALQEEKMPDFNEILKQKLQTDNHLGEPEALARSYPELAVYLNINREITKEKIDPSRREVLEAEKKSLKEQIERSRKKVFKKRKEIAEKAEKKSLKEQVERSRKEILEEKKKEEERLQRKYDLLHLQLLLVSLMEGKHSSPEKPIVLLKQIDARLKKLEGTETFRNDIQGLLASMQERRNTKNKESRLDAWKVVDTDHYEDLLLAGTEVLGSCQSVHGSPGLNKCLLGYILDGKNRLLAVKDEEGKIEARAILRLLWNGDKPALFLERVYPDAAEAPLQTALLQLAKEKAKALKIDLYTKQFKAATLQETASLRSLGSPAPFEYVDARGGVNRGGSYLIDQVFKIA